MSLFAKGLYLSIHMMSFKGSQLDINYLRAMILQEQNAEVDRRPLEMGKVIYNGDVQL